MLVYKKIKNLQLKQIFNKLEKFKKINKFLFIYLINKNIHDIVINKNLIYFFNIFNNSKRKVLMNITRRCLFTNRSRAIYRPFSLSRLVLRDLIQFGLLPGYTKAIW